jgi:hypothetical protein
MLVLLGVVARPETKLLFNVSVADFCAGFALAIAEPARA